VEFNFAEMEGTLEQDLLEIMTAIEMGFSLTEPVYRFIDYGEFDRFDRLNDENGYSVSGDKNTLQGNRAGKNDVGLRVTGTQNNLKRNQANNNNVAQYVIGGGNKDKGGNRADGEKKRTIAIGEMMWFYTDQIDETSEIDETGQIDETAVKVSQQRSWIGLSVEVPIMVFSQIGRFIKRAPPLIQGIGFIAFAGLFGEAKPEIINQLADEPGNGCSGGAGLHTPRDIPMCYFPGRLNGRVDIVRSSDSESVSVNS